ncbi:MAG: 50S ribosomal protein L11 methyltransferase [Bacteroidota bacterium]|nr:MAG: 50S ribosomal protein L11 methyltransferase [Bacteroidota bacterium]
MKYTAINIEISEPNGEKQEILVAILDSLGFEGITETTTGAVGYISSLQYDRDMLELSLAGVKDTLHAKIVHEEPVEEKNWNEEWEKNFKPVIVDHRCAIRAPFHEQFRNMEYVITLSPKMAFGTGHHETTSLMLSAILNMDLVGKRVLDMGCGTAVLAILAAMRGAKEVVAIDNDKWAYENALENIAVNAVKVEVIPGGAEVIPVKEFDTILANINRNILIEQSANYVRALNDCGQLFVSGFLAEDVEIIEATFVDLGLTPVNHQSMGNWQMLEFVK